MMNNCRTSPRVLQVISIVRRWNEWIHHRYDCPNTRSSEPCPYKLWTVGQNHQDSIFHVDSEVAKDVSGLVRQFDSFTVGPGSIFEVQADLVLSTFINVVIKEVVRHVEMLWKDDAHKDRVDLR